MHALTRASLALFLLGCRGGSSGSDGTLTRETMADSLVVDSVVYRGRLSVVAQPAGAVLRILVTARNLRQTAIALDSEDSNCPPPLTLIAEAGRARAV